MDDNTVFDAIVKEASDHPSGNPSEWVTDVTDSIRDRIGEHGDDSPSGLAPFLIHWTLSLIEFGVPANAAHLIVTQCVVGGMRFEASLRESVPTSIAHLDFTLTDDQRDVDPF